MTESGTNTLAGADIRAERRLGAGFPNALEAQRPPGGHPEAVCAPRGAAERRPRDAQMRSVKSSRDPRCRGAAHTRGGGLSACRRSLFPASVPQALRGLAGGLSPQGAGGREADQVSSFVWPSQGTLTARLRAEAQGLEPASANADSGDFSGGPST